MRWFNTNLLVNFCLVTVCVCIFVLIWDKAPSIDTPVGETDMLSKLTIAMVTGLLLAIVTLKFILPAIGDFFSGGVYGTSFKQEKSPYEKAIAKKNQGDYTEAIKEYIKVSNSETEDTFPIIEIANIYIENLEDLETACQWIEDKINSKDWEPKSEMLLAYRLSEIQAEELKDKELAVKTLRELINRHPNSEDMSIIIGKIKKLEFITSS